MTSTPEAHNPFVVPPLNADATQPCRPCGSAPQWGPSIKMDLVRKYYPLISKIIPFGKVCTRSINEVGTIRECLVRCSDVDWVSPDLQSFRLTESHPFYQTNEGRNLAVASRFHLTVDNDWNISDFTGAVPPVTERVVAVPLTIPLADHERRVKELLAANNVEVERRREAERKLKAIQSIL